jgi:hypothetical protein
MSKWTRRKQPDEHSIQMAAKLVPPGSGLRIFGKGKYQYVKTLNLDGSTTIFCFRTRAEVERAMAEGISTDAPRRGRPQA